MYFRLSKMLRNCVIGSCPDCSHSRLPGNPFQVHTTNFVYRISLPSPTSLDLISQGTKEFICRLTHPDTEGMNQKTRVENKVPCSLSSKRLRATRRSVYGWGSAATPSSQGWILQELMPGTPLDGSFESMHLDRKKNTLAQMAKFLKALQDFALPENIKGYGGVTFDDSGRIVST